MYSIVMMMALSGGADAVECHRNAGCGCVGAPVAVGCVGSAPVVVAPVGCVGCVGNYGCVGSYGCNGGHHRRHGCNGCLGGGGLFHRRSHGCNGGCVGVVVPAPCCAPAPVAAPCCGRVSSLSVAPATIANNNYTAPARVAAPVAANRQTVAIFARG